VAAQLKREPVSQTQPMTRIDRDFSARPAWEREWMIDNTWCDVCREADLGIVDPEEYELEGRIFVEGRCKKCGQQVRSEVHDEEAG
jgi:hypothetical protein